MQCNCTASTLFTIFLSISTKCTFTNLKVEDNFDQLAYSKRGRSIICITLTTQMPYKNVLLWALETSPCWANSQLGAFCDMRQMLLCNLIPCLILL